MTPIISIIIPCFNNESTITETLESVYQQKLTDYEVIIINDGSTDNSVTIIEQYSKENNLQNLIVYSTQNRGQSAARNLGAKNAMGKYLLFLDADDLIHCDYLKSGVAFLEKNNSINLVYCNAQLFGSVNEIWKLPDFDPVSLLLENSIFISAIIRKQIFEKAGAFDEKLKYIEDWDLWIRIVHLFGGIYKFKDCFFFYRKRMEKNSLTDMQLKFEDTSMLYLYQKHYELYKSNGLGIVEFFNGIRNDKKYERKYYGIWYRKLFYFVKKRSFLLIFVFYNTVGFICLIK